VQVAAYRVGPGGEIQPLAVVDGPNRPDLLLPAVEVGPRSLTRPLDLLVRVLAR
jgi:hypothetical protein